MHTVQPSIPDVQREFGLMFLKNAIIKFNDLHTCDRDETLIVQVFLKPTIRNKLQDQKSISSPLFQLLISKTLYIRYNHCLPSLNLAKCLDFG